MTADLQRENQELRQQMAQLMSRAAHNDQVLKRFQQLELRLIEIVSFRELVETILRDYRTTFELDSVTLGLIDPDYELRRLLKDAEFDVEAFPGLLFFESDEAVSGVFRPDAKPQLGAYDADRHAFVFPEALGVPASVTVLPLMRWGHLIGCLALGSANADRFQPGMATNFIERLAAVVAICLENVSNNERLKHMGLTDALTGVHNRRYFDQRLREEVDRALRKGQPLSCLLLDIDFFKRVNDTYGHQVGDVVLREVAARIKGQLRLSDAMARYGGEEFVVLLVQTDEVTAESIAERIRERIAATPIVVDSARSIPISLSIGATTLMRQSRELDVAEMANELVAAADEALYQAKSSGRDQVRVARAA